ncbi:MAG: fasciclin domain-containing protein [Flavobacteriales bacterium]|nr:fasciclin domain-containing protein [Flavobacteriales bacterium]MBK7246965.1 fasciclin domain-containing protein [Flavobacteriales bacterium]MBK7287336.1 fasciclin domain-containing protein [Flavobacteriales bacterium]MBK9061558.1 fasciclin domain-containing protein [Flavobacteriales bacterium]QQS72626.1 MAG: fasciclin domain-containing protein [Flavobacteriales bacterium]
MKRLTMKLKYFTPFALVALLSACGGSTDTAPADQAGSDPAVMTDGGQSTVVDDESEKNVVQVAIASPDHTTLVAAVKAADLVNALSNAGPFTVFAPTNEAFAALPAGTVDGLLKPDQKDALADILQYHVALGVFKPENIRDGQKQGMVNGGDVVFHVKDGQVMINDAKIIGTVPASNGLVCVIDKVLLPGK